MAGVDNIVNFDGEDVTRAGDFCSAVDPDLSLECFVRMGASLSNQLVGDQVQNACDRLSENKSWCLQGAGY
jgi:hypothetical protein